MIYIFCYFSVSLHEGDSRMRASARRHASLTRLLPITKLEHIQYSYEKKEECMVDLVDLV